MLLHKNNAAMKFNRQFLKVVILVSFVKDKTVLNKFIFKIKFKRKILNLIISIFSCIVALIYAAVL